MRERIMKNRRFKWWKSVVSALSCVVVFCTTYALILPAITMENQAYCGYEEHTHNEECYQMELICSVEDVVTEGHTHTESCYIEEQNLICSMQETEAAQTAETEESGTKEASETADAEETIESEVTEAAEKEEASGSEVHTHTAECYETTKVLACDLETEPKVEEHIHTEECYQKTFVCEKKEHTHEKICYSDKTADVETAEIWEQTLPDKLTGNGPEDLILVAESQLGYQESEKNYIITEDGSVEGYSRYGEWNGAPYENWCKAFVEFCLNYAEIDNDTLEQKSTEYIAAVGDIICFDQEIAGYEQMAIVSEIDETEGWIKVIQGDVSGEVARCTYDLTDVRISGYLAFPETEEVIEEEIIAEENEADETERLEDLNAEAPIKMFAARNATAANSGIDLTGNWSTDVAAAAAAEKGYTANADGTSKYGEWYGDAAGDMSVLFSLWCLDQAGVDPSVVPVPEKTDPVSTPDAAAWVEELKKAGLYKVRTSSYSGKPGDIAVFHTDNWQNIFSYMGILTEVFPNGSWDGSMKILYITENEVKEKIYTHKGYIGELNGFITLTDEYSTTQAGVLTATTTLNKGQVPSDAVFKVNLIDTDETCQALLKDSLIPSGNQIREDYYLEAYFETASGEKIIPDSNLNITIDFTAPLDSNASNDANAGALQWTYGEIKDGQIRDLSASLNAVQNNEQDISQISFTYQPNTVIALAASQAVNTTLETTSGNLKATATYNASLLPEGTVLVVKQLAPEEIWEDWNTKLKGAVETEEYKMTAGHFIDVHFEHNDQRVEPEVGNIPIVITFTEPLNAFGSTYEKSELPQWQIRKMINNAEESVVQNMASEAVITTSSDNGVSELKISYEQAERLALAAIQIPYTTLESTETIGTTMVTASAIAKSSVLQENMRIMVKAAETKTDEWSSQLKETYEKGKLLNSANHFFEIKFLNENGEAVSFAEDAQIEIKLEFLPALSSALADGTPAHSGEWKLHFVTEEGLEEINDENAVSTEVSEEIGLNSISFYYEEKEAYAVSAVITDPNYYDSVNSYEALVNALSGENAVSQMKLEGDITVPAGSPAIELQGDRQIFLDLNGFEITTDTTLFRIGSGAEFTLLNSQAAEETIESVATVNLRADEDEDTEAQLAKNQANVGMLASYDEVAETLTYYVTESEVINSENGATKETLVKHTAPLKGVIKGGSSPVFYVENGTLQMESGAITGCTNSAIVQNGGTINLTGGYICNNHKDSGSGGAIYSTGNSTVIVDGAVLAANSASIDGGAVWINGAQFALVSGVLSGNAADASGGGIFATGSTNVDISGGYITNNRANCLNVSDFYHSGGGGIFTNESANIYLRGGYLTGNYAQSGGGGLRTFASQFRMTGGFVNSNYANESEGGGLSINEYGIGTIVGGYINNNVSNTHQHWGGGGIFSANDTTLSIRNIIVTNNDAGGYGGGVAGCSTGRAFVYEEDGGAIYDNTAVARDSSNPHVSGGESTKAEDHLYPNSVFRQYGYEDYFCAFNSIISGTMLGGGAANWTGTVDTIPVVVAKDEIVQSTYLMGLVANPTTSGISAAQQKAKVYVNGNESYTHGGGILGNGYLVIGRSESVEVYSRLKIEAVKELIGGELTEGQFEFVIENANTGYEVATGTNDSEGNIIFDHMLPFSEEGTYEYLIYEKHTSEKEGVHEGILMDTTEYKLRIQVDKIVESLEVDEELRIEERAIIKYRYIITSMVVEKRNGGEWEVIQTVENPDNPDNKPVTLALTKGTSFHNVITDATTFSVMKKWVGNTQPQEIWVQLMQDGEAYGDAVNLNSSNNWKYTWAEELPLYRIDENGEKQYYTYSVQEVNPLVDYTVTYDCFNTTEVKAVWIPYDGSQLIQNNHYILVSPKEDYILYVSNGSSDHTIAQTDKAAVPLQEETIVVDGVEYEKYFYDGLISAESIYKAESSDGNIRLNNPSAIYRPLAIADENGGKVLKSSWWPLGMLYAGNAKICTGNNVSGNYMVVFENNQFGVAAYDASNANAAKLYTLEYTDPKNETIFTITNSKIDEDEIDYQLDITKVSADNSEVLLKGAKFALYPADETGAADTSRQAVFAQKSQGTYQYLEMKETDQVTELDLTEVITGRGGKLILSEIPKGEYVLIETEAPNGYLVAEPVTISFGSEKEKIITHRITIEDQVDKEEGGYALPDTGGPGTYVYTAGGILLLMVSALLYIKQKYRRKGGIDST